MYGSLYYYTIFKDTESSSATTHAPFSPPFGSSPCKRRPALHPCCQRRPHSLSSLSASTSLAVLLASIDLARRPHCQWRDRLSSLLPILVPSNTMMWGGAVIRWHDKIVTYEQIKYSPFLQLPLPPPPPVIPSQRTSCHGVRRCAEGLKEGGGSVIRWHDKIIW